MFFEWKVNLVGALGRSKFKVFCLKALGKTKQKTKVKQEFLIIFE